MINWKWDSGFGASVLNGKTESGSRFIISEHPNRLLSRKFDKEDDSTILTMIYQSDMFSERFWGSYKDLIRIANFIINNEDDVSFFVMNNSRNYLH